MPTAILTGHPAVGARVRSVDVAPDGHVTLYVTVSSAHALDRWAELVAADHGLPRSALWLSQGHRRWHATPRLTVHVSVVGAAA
jgi:hypothetical protein